MQGTYGERLKVQVSAPPEADRANAELIAALARWLDLPAECVTVRAGHRRRDKILAFNGIDEATLRRRLGALTGDAGPAREGDHGS